MVAMAISVRWETGLQYGFPSNDRRRSTGSECCFRYVYRNAETERIKLFFV